MDYNEATEYLFRQLPMFSRIGAAAYKPGLETSHRLDEFFGHPHRKFKSIHIAGTNGKGSTSHLIASILQQHGYKTGLYTSPHLVDFRERIRINGNMIPREDVADFVERFLKSGYEGHPSFFELTMMLAFDWFAKEKVDYAVIEVGMGGRLDSTNIITPEACVITNISPTIHNSSALLSLKSRKRKPALSKAASRSLSVRQREKCGRCSKTKLQKSGLKAHSQKIRGLSYAPFPIRKEASKGRLTASENFIVLCQAIIS